MCTVHVPLESVINLCFDNMCFSSSKLSNSPVPLIDIQSEPVSTIGVHRTMSTQVVRIRLLSPFVLIKNKLEERLSPYPNLLRFFNAILVFCVLLYFPILLAVMFAIPVLVISLVVFETADENSRSNEGYEGFQPSPGTRGTYSIIWMCLSTIFFCIYASFHDNIPPKRKIDSDLFHTFFASIERKFKYILFGFTMPELILGLALSELLDAQTGKRLMNKLSYSDWAINHSFFAAMKGFEVDDEVKDSISFYKWVKSRSSSERRLKLNPERILHDIKDRSKSNHFTKGVACIQAGWILLQTLSRLVQPLTISPLEAVACSYIICSITVYFSWWRKPYNVSERICLENESIESEEQSGNTNNTEVDGLIMELETHLNSKLPSDYPGEYYLCPIYAPHLNETLQCLGFSLFLSEEYLGHLIVFPGTFSLHRPAYG